MPEQPNWSSIAEGGKTSQEVVESTFGKYEEKKQGQPASTPSSAKNDPKPFAISGTGE